ncbi:MAG: alpha-glucan family phosphorylase [Endomicrobiales bacterium]|nr:alpha-glucan family phosphorylase [Endomicrobiales bacterium]
MKKEDIFNLSQEKHTVKNSRQYVVTPFLPEKLKPLIDIAYNIWWVWNSEAVELFRRMDRDLWEESYHNPVRMLGQISQDRLHELARDNSFLSHLERIRKELKKYLEHDTWFHKEFPDHKNCTIAYFSTEFGIHESVPIYSGGLGILSGDHLKSASDMGLPMVGVGLLFRYGYFKQYLNFDGWQQEEYIESHFSRMPLQRIREADGSQKKIVIELDSKKIHARLWKLQVGRIPLHLLDTDIDENKPEDREISGKLYGGDRDMRIRQELVLGIGGIKMLKALGIEPNVIHINEGHSAFLSFERIRMLMEENKLSFEEAKEVVKGSCVFTTHTPVPAGNEVFAADLIEKYVSPLYKKMGLSSDEFMSLGRINPKDDKENFCLTVLALKTSNFANGVSKLHGTISRNMWKEIWPEIPRSEIPITHITNGVHPHTWISYEMAGLFDRYIGTDWREEPADHSLWDSIEQIPDSELWRSHERRRERLVSFARNRLKAQLLRRGASPNEIHDADQVLDPEALTIGFARRFAGYKRGNLLFRDMDRLKALLTNREKPVQVIIAGKSHPADNIGKEVIKSIIHLTRDPELRHKVVFIEDYDMNVAHYIVQGADVWLNNPRRPAEASGTSGMKAAVNGVLNVSVLDGWWCEGYNGQNGWKIGSGEEYTDHEYQDEIESKAIYDIFEKDIVPMFYNRGTDGLPRDWIGKMKTIMRSICPVFNTNRMIEEYTRKFYGVAYTANERLRANNFEHARRLVEWQKSLVKNWGNIKVVSVEDDLSGDVILGNNFNVKASVKLGGVQPDSVKVELYWGYLDSKRRMSMPIVETMQLKGSSGDTHSYEGQIKSDRVGHCGYVIRVLPQVEGKALYVPGLIVWS